MIYGDVGLQRLLRTSALNIEASLSNVKTDLTNFAQQLENGSRYNAISYFSPIWIRTARAFYWYQNRWPWM